MPKAPNLDTAALLERLAEITDSHGRATAKAFRGLCFAANSVVDVDLDELKASVDAPRFDLSGIDPVELNEATQRIRREQTDLDDPRSDRAALLAAHYKRACYAAGRVLDVDAVLDELDPLILRELERRSKADREADAAAVAARVG